MATSQYFSNYSARNEQNIIEDLIVESIQIMGFDGFYLPNDNDIARDILFGEDPTKRFESAFPVELYLSNITDYSGEGEIFSKFGLEIRNNVQVILSKRAFSKRIPTNTFTRPREGDLIYVPFLNGEGELFEIKFTNQAKDFFMLGKKVPYFYELDLEKFKYSNEVIATGIPDIDIVVTQSSYTLNLDMQSGTGNYLSGEIAYQSLDGTLANSTVSATVQSWSAGDKILSLTNILGEYVDTRKVIGETSNAQYTLLSFDPLATHPKNENLNNEYIEIQANLIKNTSESNPLGSL
jgi:hypothetical protein